MHTYNTYMNVCCCAYVDAVSCVHAALPESLFTFKLYNIRACRMDLEISSRQASLQLHPELQILGCVCWQVSPFAAKSADGRLMRVPWHKL